MKLYIASFAASISNYALDITLEREHDSGGFVWCNDSVLLYMAHCQLVFLNVLSNTAVATVSFFERTYGLSGAVQIADSQYSAKREKQLVLLKINGCFEVFDFKLLIDDKAQSLSVCEYRAKPISVIESFLAKKADNALFLKNNERGHSIVAGVGSGNRHIYYWNVDENVPIHVLASSGIPYGVEKVEFMHDSTAAILLTMRKKNAKADRSSSKYRRLDHFCRDLYRSNVNCSDFQAAIATSLSAYSPLNFDCYLGSDCCFKLLSL